jgi:hypothetical protein
VNRLETLKARVAVRVTHQTRSSPFAEWEITEISPCSRDDIEHLMAVVSEIINWNVPECTKGLKDALAYWQAEDTP